MNETNQSIINNIFDNLSNNSDYLLCIPPETIYNSLHDTNSSLCQIHVQFITQYKYLTCQIDLREFITNTSCKLSSTLELILNSALYQQHSTVDFHLWLQKDSRSETDCERRNPRHCSSVLSCKSLKILLRAKLDTTNTHICFDQATNTLHTYLRDYLIILGGIINIK